MIYNVVVVRWDSSGTTQPTDVSLVAVARLAQTILNVTILVFVIVKTPSRVTNVTDASQDTFNSALRDARK